MARKPKMSITSRFLAELPPIAAKQVANPFPNPPPNRGPIARLSFRGPSPKLDWSAADLAHAIGVAALPDAALFLDTNIFTREQLDASVWDAIYTKRIFITPGVWREILPWLETPFHNKVVRDHVFAAVQKQVSLGPLPQDSGSGEISKLQVLLLNEDFTKHGYEYYLRLLALRKGLGPLANAVLTKRL
jgi:hypothetical protein